MSQTQQKRLFVLDTNILMHDPSALFRFEEHDIFLPIVVLEELDNHKRGSTELARNVRQTSRTLDELLSSKTHQEILEGIPLSLDHVNLNGHQAHPTGRLYFQSDDLAITLPSTLPGNNADNSILAISLALQKKHRDKKITLVSKDINLRIKADILGINSEDYYNDKVLDDVHLLHNGVVKLPDDFWDNHSKAIDSWMEEGKTFYKISGPLVENWFINDCLYHCADESKFEAIVRSKDRGEAIIEVLKDYRQSKHSIWGITARNREQNCALNVLLDPNIDFVSLQGQAGSGKTLLALAAGLYQTLDEKRYKEIVMTRVTVPVGEDIGFLPGTEEEKMTPWMGALMDNLEVLYSTDEDGEWEREVTHELLQNKIKIRSLNFMRGRTFLNRFIIIDEAQNLTSKQIKTLVTRAGPGTKMVCLGDIGQIDTPYLTETTSGLTYAMDRFKDWSHSAQIQLIRGERSRLADYAAEKL